MVLSFSKDNFGKFHQDLPLLQLYEGLKMGVFLHKNVKTFDDGGKNVVPLCSVCHTLFFQKSKREKNILKYAIQLEPLAIQRYKIINQ